jgi:hypothetical protein
MDDHQLRRQRGKRIAAARQIAGDKDVSIASANIAAQALDLGLVDEVSISLVPVLMGKGIPYFASLAHAPHRFDDPVIIPRQPRHPPALCRTADRRPALLSLNVSTI